MPKPRKNDCLRQCVARVTGRPPATVPHFVKLHKGRWVYALSVWCKRTGHAIAYMKYRDLNKVHIAGATPKQCILIGPTRKGKRSPTHAVIANHTGKIIYDGGISITNVQRFLIIWKVARQDQPLASNNHRIQRTRKIRGNSQSRRN